MVRSIPTAALPLVLALHVLALLGCTGAIAQTTTVTITDSVVIPAVKRLGINLGARSRWGDAQILKNLIDNPGFEAGDYSSVVLADSGSTARTFRQGLVNAGGPNVQPAGFWNGAEYEIVWGAAKGRRGHIVDFSVQNGRYVFGLDTDGTAPAATDVMLVRRRVPGIFGNTTTADTNATRPGSPGRQSMRMSAANPRFDFYMDSYWRDGDRSAGKFLPVRGRWRLEVWAKGSTGAEMLHASFFREGTPPFIDHRTALTTEWQHFSWDVDLPANADTVRVYGPSEYRPILDMRLETGAAAQEIWVDDVALYRLDDTNTTVFTDAFVERIQELHPGIVRDWSTQFGSTLDAQIAPVHARRTSGSRSDANAPGSYGYGLHDFLELARLVGAEPWYVIPPTFSPAELGNLIDYLAAPAHSAIPSADRRAALGQEAPWTDVFPRIHLEYGNELWGGATVEDPFQGASVRGGVRLGAIASDRLAILRANPFFRAGKFNLIIGGQAGFPGRQQEIQANAVMHDAVALAPYFGVLDSIANDKDIFGSLFDTPFYQAGPAGPMRQSRDFLDAGAHPAELAIYEINFHTTNGSAPIAVRNDFLTGLDGGIALPMIMLTYLRDLRAVDQCAFTTLGYSFRMGNGEYAKVWGLLRDLYATGRKRPTWLGLEMANRAILSTEVAAYTSGTRPRWSQPAINGIGTATEVQEIQPFAFTDSTRHSAVVFNLSLTSPHTVRLQLPGPPTRGAARLLLNAPSIHDDNEDSETVVIASDSITDFAQNYQLELPAHSMTVLRWEDGRTNGVRPLPAALSGTSATLAVASPATSDALVRFALPAAGPIRLELVDMTGRVIRTLAAGDVEAGSHSAPIAGGGRLAGGCYILRLTAGGNVVVRKVIVLE